LKGFYFVAYGEVLKRFSYFLEIKNL